MMRRCCPARSRARSELLLVDDDEPFLRRLARAMEKRGFEVETARSVAEGRRGWPGPTAGLRGGRSAARRRQRARGDRGLRDGPPDCRIVVLTGYGAIATAVAAVKIGASDYLSKPADADDVTRAAGPRRRSAAAAGKPDVGRPGALGTYPAGLRAMRPQCLRDRAAAEHAPPHLAADPGQEKPALTVLSGRGATGPGRLYAA